MTNRTTRPIVRSLIIRLLAIPALLLSGIPAGADEVGLQCEMTDGGVINLLVEAEEGEAVLVLDTYSVDGKVNSTETHYRFVFPKTERRYEIHITVNRLYGSLSWEHGVPPFGDLSQENVRRRGECLNNAPED